MYTIIGVFCCISLFAQETDPFYLNVLQKGEQAFQNKDYRTAVNKLEIAIFGLQAEKELLVKTYVYLCLSHYYLKEQEKSEKYLSDAKNLAGEEGLFELEIEEPVLSELERLIYAFKAGSTTKPGQKFLPHLPKEGLAAEGTSGQKQLEEKIKKNPRDASLRYTLYDIHRDKSDFNSAKKTIKDLVKYNRDEIYGYYLLGIIQYQEKKYKEAITSFISFFRLTGRIPVEEKTLIEAKAYHILSAHHHGDKEIVTKIITEAIELMNRAKIRSLPLTDRDKSILRGLLNDYL